MAQADNARQMALLILMISFELSFSVPGRSLASKVCPVFSPKETRMKVVAALICSLLPLSGLAAGYSGWAVPSQVEWVSGGILITGNFTDVNGCGQANKIFLDQAGGDIESFKMRVAMVLAGFAAQKEMQFYSVGCTTVPFHYSGNVINAANINGVYIRN